MKFGGLLLIEAAKPLEVEGDSPLGHQACVEAIFEGDHRGAQFFRRVVKAKIQHGKAGLREGLPEDFGIGEGDERIQGFQNCSKCNGDLVILVGAL